VAKLSPKSVPERKPEAAVVKPVEPRQTASADSQHPSGRNRKQHTVQKGEGLYAISKKYAVTVEQIKKWNNLTEDGLREGQNLWVAEAVATSIPSQVAGGATPLKAVQPEPKPVDPKGAAVSDGKPGTNSGPGAGGDSATVKVESGTGVHVVQPGETLFGIARTYGMDVKELRRINRLEDATIQEGQSLRVKADSPENPHQGTALIEAIERVQDSTPSLEQFPDLKVLTVPTATVIPAEAVVTVYKDKSSGTTYKRIEETGRAGSIQDFATDQTRFYAFHRHLPTGSYIRVDYPKKGQSILVEVINQLPENDPYVIRLSARCLDYLMIREPGADVRLRYVVPLGE
jgi:LysM repeat protein